VWRYAGFYMLLMLVGLQGIPADVFEAARIDGANRWQAFRRVTLPLLRPTLALTTVLCVTGSMLAFEQFYILTKGGPDNSTISVVQLIYIVAFQGQNDLGVAAAISVLALVVLVVVNVVQLRAFRATEGS
jgi:multiple sugar transport system permease protein